MQFFVFLKLQAVFLLVHNLESVTGEEQDRIIIFRKYLHLGCPFAEKGSAGCNLFPFASKITIFKHIASCFLDDRVPVIEGTLPYLPVDVHFNGKIKAEGVFSDICIAAEGFNITGVSADAITPDKLLSAYVLKTSVTIKNIIDFGGGDNE